MKKIATLPVTLACIIFGFSHQVSAQTTVPGECFFEHNSKKNQTSTGVTVRVQVPDGKPIPRHAEGGVNDDSNHRAEFDVAGCDKVPEKSDEYFCHGMVLSADFVPTEGHLDVLDESNQSILSTGDIPCTGKDTATSKPSSHKKKS